MKPSEMKDQELVEAWFVEVHGWEYEVDRTGNVHGQDDTEYLGDYQTPDLPNILDSESAFNEWVLPVMGEMGLEPVHDPVELQWWTFAVSIAVKTVEIKNNRRLRAAVEAALEIVRGRGEVEHD